MAKVFTVSPLPEMANGKRIYGTSTGTGALGACQVNFLQHAGFGKLFLWLCNQSMGSEHWVVIKRDGSTLPAPYSVSQ